MATTDKALWRSVRKEEFPDGTVIGDDPAPGVLYPDFYARTLPSGSVRQADVVLHRDGLGQEWVKSAGGTSLFDVKSVFKGKSWLCFEIPEGTVIPASLVVRETGYNPRFPNAKQGSECTLNGRRWCKSRLWPQFRTDPSFGRHLAVRREKCIQGQELALLRNSRGYGHSSIIGRPRDRLQPAISECETGVRVHFKWATLV